MNIAPANSTQTGSTTPIPLADFLICYHFRGKFAAIANYKHRCHISMLLDAIHAEELLMIKRFGRDYAC